MNSEVAIGKGGLNWKVSLALLVGAGYLAQGSAVTNSLLDCLKD